MRKGVPGIIALFEKADWFEIRNQAVSLNKLFLKRARDDLITRTFCLMNAVRKDFFLCIDAHPFCFAFIENTNVLILACKTYDNKNNST